MDKRPDLPKICLGFQAADKKGGSQGPVSWSGAYKMKSEQKRTAADSGSVSLRKNHMRAIGRMEDNFSGTAYYARTIFCMGL